MNTAIKFLAKEWVKIMLSSLMGAIVIGLTALSKLKGWEIVFWISCIGSLAVILGLILYWVVYIVKSSNKELVDEINRIREELIFVEVMSLIRAEQLYTDGITFTDEQFKWNYIDNHFTNERLILKNRLLLIFDKSSSQIEDLIENYYQRHFGSNESVS